MNANALSANALLVGHGYHIDDRYYAKANDPDLLPNKGVGKPRPVIYGGVDPHNPNIHWMIPLTTDKNGQAMHEHTKRENALGTGNCKGILFSSYGNKRCALRIDKMFPVTTEYLVGTHTYKGTHSSLPGTDINLAVSNMTALRQDVFNNVKNSKERVLPDIKQLYDKMKNELTMSKLVDDYRDLTKIHTGKTVMIEHNNSFHSFGHSAETINKYAGERFFTASKGNSPRNLVRFTFVMKKNLDKCLNALHKAGKDVVIACEDGTIERHPAREITPQMQQSNEKEQQGNEEQTMDQSNTAQTNINQAEKSEGETVMSENNTNTTVPESPHPQPQTQAVMNEQERYVVKIKDTPENSINKVVYIVFDTHEKDINRYKDGVGGSAKEEHATAQAKVLNDNYKQKLMYEKQRATEDPNQQAEQSTVENTTVNENSSHVASPNTEYTSEESFDYTNYTNDNDDEPPFDYDDESLFNFNHDAHWTWDSPGPDEWSPQIDENTGKNTPLNIDDIPVDSKAYPLSDIRNDPLNPRVHSGLQEEINFGDGINSKLTAEQEALRNKLVQIQNEGNCYNTIVDGKKGFIWVDKESGDSWAMVSRNESVSDIVNTYTLKGPQQYEDTLHFKAHQRHFSQQDIDIVDVFDQMFPKEPPQPTQAPRSQNKPFADYPIYETTQAIYEMGSSSINLPSTEPQKPDFSVVECTKNGEKKLYLIINAGDVNIAFPLDIDGET